MRRLLNDVLELLYPRGLCCGLCGAELEERGTDARHFVATGNAPIAAEPLSRIPCGGLCPRCRPELPPPENPCPGCGRGTLQGHLCRNCTRHGNLSDGACVAFDYEGMGRQLLLGFKFRDNTGHAELLGWALHRAVEAAGWPGAVDCVVPVPIHWRRRLQRGYNQTELLCRELARRLEVPVVRGVLSRPAYTRPLASSGAGALARAENARRSFGPGKGDLSGKNVLLVDDIVTTGATVRACVDILRAMGAQKVFVAAAAAVPQRVP